MDSVTVYNNNAPSPLKYTSQHIFILCNQLGFLIVFEMLRPQTLCPPITYIFSTDKKKYFCTLKLVFLIILMLLLTCKNIKPTSKYNHCGVIDYQKW